MKMTKFQLTAKVAKALHGLEGFKAEQVASNKLQCELDAQSFVIQINMPREVKEEETVENPGHPLFEKAENVLGDVT